MSVDEWMTTSNPLLEWPRKFAWMRFRAWTDCEPEASQPAPDSAFSARGATVPRPTTIRTHEMATVRPWVEDNVQAGRAGRDSRRSERFQLDGIFNVPGMSYRKFLSYLIRSFVL